VLVRITAWFYSAGSRFISQTHYCVCVLYIQSCYQLQTPTRRICEHSNKLKHP